ncbi:sensor histidine kinase [Myroides sp. DW712]|uniref:sensor histidine kinase n=1 Tax=Myroides sp. DW712 TaxID=3389800 RepID=UPI00397C27EC
MIVNWYRHLVLAVSLGILISLAISYYSFYDSALSLGEILVNPQFVKNTFFSFVLSLLIYASNVLMSLVVSGALNKRERKTGVVLSQRLRNTLYFFSGIITSIVTYYLFLGLLLQLFFNLPFADFWQGNHFRLGNFLGVVLVSVFILLLVFAFAYHDQLRILELKNKEMEITLQKNQIERMKEQLSPHFLFNNLNVLISTIQEDAVKAEQFARSFSKIYRYVLERLDATSSTLADELKFSQDYVYLLNVRYDNAINFHLAEEVYEYSNVLIPTLSLQLLLENVVKHNSIPSEGKISIALCIVDGGLKVWNEKYTKPKQEYTSELGLKNLSSRCQVLMQQEIRIEETAREFSVIIPLPQNEKG